MSSSTNDATLGGSLRPRGPVQLALTTQEHADVTVVAVKGELDLLTAPRLTTYLDDVVRRGRSDVVIDLREADFIDSLGLHALLSVQRRLARQGRGLTVVCAAGAVLRAIELARLTEALGVVPAAIE